VKQLSKENMMKIPRVLPFAVAALLLSGVSAYGQSDYVEVEKLYLEPDPLATDRFGEALVIEGDTIVVSSDEHVLGVGAVYIYERNEGGSNRWGLVQRLLAPVPELGDHYGGSLGLSGDSLVVTTARTPDELYVYERDGAGTWQLVTLFDEQLTGDADIDDGTMIAGNTIDDVILLFERSFDGEWEVVSELRPSVGTDFVGFSSVVAIDTDVIVAGDRGDDVVAPGAGAIYVFERDEFGLWGEEEVVKLWASDASSNEEFGTSVAVEDDLIAVGSNGVVYLFERDGFGVWTETAKLLPEDQEFGGSFGESVGISERKVVVGEDFKIEPGLDAVGAIYVFEEETPGVWDQGLKLLASDGEEFDLLGSAVAISGGTVVAGSIADDDLGFDTGSAYVFQVQAEPEMQFSGSCLGQLTLSVSGATPSGSLAIVQGTGEGETIVPSGSCSGLALELDNATLARRVFGEEDGTFSLSTQMGAGLCGVSMQVVDVVTCGTSGIAAPESR